MPSTRLRWRHLLPMLVLVPAMLAGTFVNAAAAQDSVEVRISTALDPSFLRIEVGTSVTWRNLDGEEHQMRSETGPAEFDTDDLEPGVSATITFTVPGTYTYADHHDPENHEYQGTIVVVREGSGIPSPGDPGTTPPPPPPTEATVGMAGRVFRPANLTVGVGATVTFFNDDGRAHTATANDLSWDSGNFEPGQSYQKTFTAPGTFAYFCVIHPDMIGTIEVVGGDGSAPAPPPAPTPDPTPPAPIPATSQQVEIIDFDYSPTALTIATGGSVTWRNTGPTPHTVTSDAGTFDSGYMFTTDTFTSTFPDAGNYNYYCTLHPEMRATVIVGAGGPVPDSSTATDPNDATTSTPAPAAPVGGLSVAMLDNNFSPQSITVTAGSVVRWGNNGQALHTVTAGDGSFDSGFIEAGRTYSRRFSVPGTFGYVCIIHPGMSGTVLVTDSAGTAPPPDAAPTIAEPDDDATATPDSGTAESFRINVIDLDYDPRDLTVPVGTEVLWVNTGQAPHTVTDNDDDLVDSGIFMPGESYSLLFDEEGVFDYYCTLHPGMEGRVTITEGAEVAFAEKNVAETPAPPAADNPASDIVALDLVQYSGGINGAAVVISVGAALGALALGYMALRDWVRLPKTHP